MKTLFSGLLAGAALLLGISEASAQAVSATSVACSTTRKLQTAINSAATGTVATINVTGTCTENIVIPHGKTVIINGANATARIVPANNLRPAILAYGNTTLQKLAIINAAGTADSLVETQNSMLNIIASDLSAPNVASVLGVYDSSMARIVNSRVSGGRDGAVEIWGGSTAVLKGDFQGLAGPAALETQISSPLGGAVLCNFGSTLISRVNASGSLGSVKIHNSREGISSTSCSLSLKNLTVTGTGTGNGFALNAADVSLTDVTVSNFAWGINANMSRMTIVRSSFSNNTDGDVGTWIDSTIQIPDWGPGWISSFPDYLDAGSFKCSSGSTIYVARNAVQQQLGTTYDATPCVVMQ